MVSNQELAAYRAGTIARLNKETRENDETIARLKARNAEIEASMARFDLQLPPNACPICFYEQGITTLLRAIPADTATPTVDRFRCANGHDF